MEAEGLLSGILTADIDLAGYEWTPIGTASKKFAGTFNGRNHTIDHLSINYSSKTPISLYRGLFGWVSGANATNRAKIENLTVNGTVVAGSNKPVNDAYVGGIVGRADYADLRISIRMSMFPSSARPVTTGRASAALSAVLTTA